MPQPPPETPADPKPIKPRHQIHELKQPNPTSATEPPIKPRSQTKEGITHTGNQTNAKPINGRKTIRSRESQIAGKTETRNLKF
jgi:hypothetical protein